MSNKETIASIYKAFLEGDIPFILSQLADDVEWGYATDNSSQKKDLPWMKLYSGRESVNDFFKAVEKMEIYQFDILSLLEGENEVAARLNIGCKYFLDEIIHFWTFDDDGKVIRYQQFTDTAKHIAGFESAERSAAA